MISVCLASYNGEKYIQEQLSSILPQLNFGDEIIVSDDHSTDRTIAVIAALNDERIKVFSNENNKGYSKNFENAINKANGDIIFICDQDDVWMENKVEVMVNALSKASLAVHDALIVNDSLSLINHSHFDLYKVKGGFCKNFVKTRYVGACMAFKKELLVRALPFPKKQDLCAYDYWLTLVGEYYYKVILVPEPLIKYRRHSFNASTGGTKSQNSLTKKIKVRLYSLYELFKR